MEFKVAKKLKDLPHKAQEAVGQIEERRYAWDLAEDGYGQYAALELRFAARIAF